MKFEWDDDKAKSNRAKHKVSFEEAQTVFQDPFYLIFADSIMKKKSEANDELRPEYDFSQLTLVARGPRRRKSNKVTVTLAPDVAKSFSHV